MNCLHQTHFFVEKIQNEFSGEKNMGDTVVTTLDADLQQAAYDALGDNKGAVIVMEADTGKILAMVSKPTFDPNEIRANWETLNSDEENSPLLESRHKRILRPRVFIQSCYDSCVYAAEQ